MRIAVVTQKGGAGKTTLATNIAVELAAAGDRVLLIDADRQRTALDWSQMRASNGLDAAKGPHLTVIGIDNDTIHRQIDNLMAGYDHVVIDGPPRAEKVDRSAMMAVEFVLVPVQPSSADVWAAETTLDVIAEARTFRPTLLAALVINRRIPNTVMASAIRDLLRDFTVPTLATSIGQRVIFAECLGRGSSVIEDTPEGIAAAEIGALVGEIKELLR